MKTDTSHKILDFIKQRKQITVQDLVIYLGHSPQAIHRQLKKLVETKKIQKIGKPPKVYYQLFVNNFLTATLSSYDEPNFDSLINDKFIQILPDGTELFGYQAFIYWCGQRGFDITEYSQKFNQIYTKYEFYKNSQGIIDATSKLNNTYKNQVFLAKLFYLEFSALEIFGKTKAYTYLFYSKLNENRKMMYQIFDDLKVNLQVDKIINFFDIQAVAFIPPTVPRKIQIQKELERFLDLNLPVIEIIKIQTPILVPQKTLSSPQERIINSQSTFVVPKFHNYKKILLIDDFTGSGATLNFVAQKILDKSAQQDALNVQIYGLTLCGTPNGLINNSQKFEVIKEI